MIKVFNEAEQRAIQEKVKQLSRIKEGTLSARELADLITRRRIDWIRVHLEDMLDKYGGLSPEEQAYRIIFFEHMGINPTHSRMQRVSPSKIRIESYNFCPYLEACLQLGLDTREICREVGEPSIQAMARIIHPDLVFSRDYTPIRPYCDYCEEFFELK